MSPTFASLVHRNYRLWFIGQLISLFGTWMQVAALGFLLYQITGRAADLGILGFTGAIPNLIIMPLAGSFIDRHSRRKILIVTQALLMVLAIILMVLTYTHSITPNLIYLISFLASVVTAVDQPARQALVGELVTREHIANAIALNSAMFNLAAILGPALGGILYEVVGPAACFAINAISFGAVIISLSAMRKLHGEPDGSEDAPLKDAYRMYFTHPFMMQILLIVAVISFFGNSLFVLMPAWSVKVLGGGASLNGYLQAWRGVGALLGALLAATLIIKARRYYLRAMLVVFPASVVIFSLSTSNLSSFITIAVFGGTLTLLYNLCNSLAQTAVPSRIRGRVMGIYGSIMFSLMPIGSLFVGLAAQKYSEAVVVWVCGIAMTLILWPLGALLHAGSPVVQE